MKKLLEINCKMLYYVYDYIIGNFWIFYYRRICIMSALTSNKSVLSWIDEKVELVKPDKIVWIDGSKEQIEELRATA